MIDRWKFCNTYVLQIFLQKCFESSTRAYDTCEVTRVLSTTVAISIYGRSRVAYLINLKLSTLWGTLRADVVTWKFQERIFNFIVVFPMRAINMIPFIGVNGGVFAVQWNRFPQLKTLVACLDIFSLNQENCKTIWLSKTRGIVMYLYSVFCCCQSFIICLFAKYIFTSYFYS